MSVPGSMIGMLLGLVAIFASAYATPVLRLVYNASDSAPYGWYVVSPTAPVQRGDYIVARLPQDVAMLAAERGYVPLSIPVLKRAAAVGGQHVCVRDGLVHVDGVAIGNALNRDGFGRPLTAWQQCRPLLAGELFLMNSAAPASFDSRYFGPIDASFVRGRAIRLAMFSSDELARFTAKLGRSIRTRRANRQRRFAPFDRSGSVGVQGKRQGRSAGLELLRALPGCIGGGIGRDAQRQQNMYVTHPRRNDIMNVYAGLDVALRETSICIVNAEGKVVLERKVASEPDDIVPVLQAYVGELRQVGVEASSL